MVRKLIFKNHLLKIMICDKMIEEVLLLTTVNPVDKSDISLFRNGGTIMNNNELFIQRKISGKTNFTLIRFCFLLKKLGDKLCLK